MMMRKRTNRCRNTVWDISVISRNKNGETLCGDQCALEWDDNDATVILSDGLGSGVKANILSTLTTTMLTTMLKGNVPIDECVTTVAETLPMCKERKLAYATFTILQTAGTRARLIQYAVNAVDERRGFFDQNDIFYERKVHLTVRDAEIPLCPQRLHAVIGVPLHLQFADGITLRAVCFFHVFILFVSVNIPIVIQIPPSVNRCPEELTEIFRKKPAETSAGNRNYAIFLTISGFLFPFTASRSTTTFSTSPAEGRSYMLSISRFSNMVRSPRAPVFSSIARFATSSMASSVNSSSTLSSPISFLYYLTRAFRGSVRMLTSAFSSSGCRPTTMGTRPTNSGISPNLMRSCGWTSRINS